MDVINSVLLCIVAVLTGFYAYFKYSFGYFQSRGIPCSTPSIPYGHIKGLGKKYHMSEILKKIYDEFKPTDAKVCGVYLFHRPIVMLLDLELIKNVFVKGEYLLPVQLKFELVVVYSTRILITLSFQIFQILLNETCTTMKVSFVRCCLVLLPHCFNQKSSLLILLIFFQWTIPFQQIY